MNFPSWRQLAGIPNSIAKAALFIDPDDWKLDSSYPPPPSVRIADDHCDWSNYLDDPGAIECGRMYVEHCWKLKARR